MDPGDVERRGRRVVRLAVAAYRTALCALPGGFRRRYGQEAVEDFRAEAERQAREGGSGGVLLALSRAVGDLALRAPGEWRRNTRRGREGTIAMWWSEMVKAARSLARRPGFSAVAALTLALGIGATTAIYTVVESILLRPLPYADSDRIVHVTHHAPGLDFEDMATSGGLARVYAEHAPEYEAFGIYSGGRANLTGGDRPERVETVEATAELLEVLAVTPRIGRAFTPEEALPGGPEVAVFTHRGWVDHLGSQPDVVGRTVVLDGTTVEIVGVMPDDFAFPDAETAVILPYRLGPDSPFGTFGMNALARLAPGVDLEQARRQTEAFQARLPEFFPEMTRSFFEQAGWAVTVEPWRDWVVEDVEQILWLVLGTVGFVLLIACANVANLFLVRAEARQREMAVRAAMGAGSGRLAVTFLAESLVLGIAGGLLGVGLAALGVRGLVALGPTQMPRLHEIGLDGSVLLVALGISVGSGLLFGGLPLGRYLGRSFARVLRDGSRSVTDSRARHRGRNLLVASQLALALVLLVGSGLLIRSFERLMSVDPGFEAEGVLAVSVNAGEGADHAKQARFYQEVAERVRALPGVITAGVMTALPLGSTGMTGGSFAIESRPRAEDDLPPTAMNIAVAEGALEALDIPILAGRAPTRADHETEAAVAWVNETFARTILDGNALGQRVATGPGDGEEQPEWSEIVGVLGDVHHIRLDEEVGPLIYLPMTGPFARERLSLASAALVVEASDNPMDLAPAVRAIVAEVDPTVPVTLIRTMDQVVSESLARASFTMTLVVIAAAMALVLGAVGIYGVIAYVVSQRTREIGVRMALGARGQDVQGMVVRQGLAVAALGIGVGLAAAWALTRLMGSLLYEVSVHDPVTFMAVPVVLAAVAVTASWLPALRASRVHPSEALRSE